MNVVKLRFTHARSALFFNIMLFLCAACSVRSALADDGMRKVQSKHLVLYTDLPASQEVDELPDVFDAMIPALCNFFNLNPKNYETFTATGYLIDDEKKFDSSGALRQVPKLRNGYALRQRFWLRKQDSPYYQRHLFIHEGVHLFMEYAFGGWGPPWYREGTAEFLGTHQWNNGKLELGYFPKDRKELLRWGRIDILQNDFRNHNGKTLDDVFHLAAENYNENEAYSWSWAFAAFCVHHPLYANAYRKTARYLNGKADEAANRFLTLVAEESKKKKEELNETQIVNRLENEWADFVRNVEYGYDFERTAVVYRSTTAEQRATVSVLAARGWQSSGIALERGKTYRITASGRFQLGNKPSPWMSEPNGITIRYHHGLPIGTLSAAQIPDINERFLVKPETPGIGFAFPKVIGTGTEWKAEVSGMLYFRINDFPSELEDNSGTAEVKIEEK
jgi:hypothetical protein